MTKQRLRGHLLILAGSLLMAAAVFLILRNGREEIAAGESAEFLLQELQQEMAIQEETSVYDTAVEEELPAGEVARTTLAGHDLIGMLRVDTLGMELPILGNWSYDLLKISPCRYSGSVEGGDLILLGHNYKKHFTPLKQIAVGDWVVFTDVKGVDHTYEVTATEILQKTELERLTTSGSALTIFTCTNGGHSRFVVRCSPVETSGTTESTSYWSEQAR